jgi:hypothetical protein
MFLNTEKNISTKNKVLKREHVSDMEIDGIRFSERDKAKLDEVREKLHCNYSGLPSIYAYE